MMAADGLAVALGVAVIWVGLNDAFLTILHPDRDGRLSYTLNRGIWRVTAQLALWAPQRRQVILGFAGPTMVIADILLWMMVPILGYALLMGPFLGDGIRIAGGLEGTFGDALYFSGVTFTTLGYGDVTPVTRTWEMVSILEALTGFLVMGTSVTYIIAVFEGVDKRDARALQVYSETGGTWDGAELIRRCVASGDAGALRRRFEEWGFLVRDLHGRLYRFHGLALYVRTQGLDFGPERMVNALAEVALRAKLIAIAPGQTTLLPAAEQLTVGVEHFARSLVRRNGRRGAFRAMEAAQPGPLDVARVKALQAEMAEFLGQGPGAGASVDAGLLAMAARMRVFVEELDRLTLWHRLEAAARSAGRELH